MRRLNSIILGILMLWFPLYVIADNLLEGETAYCRGFKHGYIEGWCEDDPFCVEPIPPICPIPKIDERESSFEDGYNRGFIRGYFERRD